MTTATKTSWQQAEKAPFEAFGILYYPLFAHRADLEGVELGDADMAWAVTANANLDGTGYTLSQPSILTLAAFHHLMAELAAQSPFLPLADALGDHGVNPIADLKRLVPDVTAIPMYPDFPQQVMELDEATFRYHQAMHYASTYGVELVAGLLGLDVEVGKGWLPDVESTPKEREDETLVAPKVLHLVMTVEDLRAIVAARLERATRMHPAEIATTLLVFEGLGKEGADEEVSFPRIAFHENMMELIRVAAQDGSGLLERVAVGLAQHPGDLLKAIRYVLDTDKVGHLATRQKKGFCRAFEHFGTMAIAHNIADAGRKPRHAPLYLSVARFGGPHLTEAIELVDSGQVRSWASELELRWAAVDKAIAAEPTPQKKGLQGFFSKLFTDTPAPSDEATQAWQALLDHYGTRPGMLFRSLIRLAKHGCPDEMLLATVEAHAESFSLPTLIRTLTIMSEGDKAYRVKSERFASFSIALEAVDEETQAARVRLAELLRTILTRRLAVLDTPLKGKRVHLDTAGISLRGSLLMPNETGDTGTAWPPVGMAWDLPEDKTVRFFTFWDDRSKRVDVDLHFVGRRLDGDTFSIGWNAHYKDSGLMTSGDITSSQDSIEFLDADMAAARKGGVHLVVQKQHIYAGAPNWCDIATCYSGATIVSDTARDVKLVSPENVIFRDDLTGKGRDLNYAVVNFPCHYVRILRGADIPLGTVDFCLGDYLEALLAAQGATLVEDPKKADVRACIGRSEDPEVVSLFDEGFFIK